MAILLQQAQRRHRQGSLQEALAAYDQTLFLTPDFAEAHYNKAHLLLLLGDFEHGWPLYEWRWHT